jgi:hypothetical protein
MTIKKAKSAKLPATLTINGKQRPTTNSKGQPIATTEQGIRNFYKWFGNSKVVDEKGRPLVVYRGHEASNNVADTKLTTPTFTTNEDVAIEYASEYEDGIVTSSYLSIKNMLVFGEDDGVITIKNLKDLLPDALFNKIANLCSWSDDGDYVDYTEAPDNAYTETFYIADNPDFIDWAKSKGFDGQSYKGIFTGDVENADFSIEIRPFFPTQIKSATGNDGSFDADDVSILSGLPANHLQFVEKVKAELSGENRHNKRTIEKMAGFYGISDQNLIKELTELAIVSIARSLAQQPGKGIQQKFSEIVELYHNQVNLSHRTSRSILLQQYSTPAPLAYMMGVYVASGTGFVAKPWPTPQKPPAFFEPSAGNGLLTIAIPPEYWDVNEIDETRRANLEQQGYNQVTAHNAADPLIFDVEPRKYDGVITNPPFGRLDEPVKTGGFLLDELDHVMAAYALECMKNTGRAAIITGGHITYDEKTGRIKQQGDKGGNRNFYNFLYHNYNVEDILYINGDLYSRQGTSFDVRLILINGRKETPAGFAPRQTPEMNAVINTWDEFYTAMDRLIQPETGNLPDAVKMIKPENIDTVSKSQKQPWEMTREKFVGEGYVFYKTDRALKTELNKWQKLKDEADKENYNIDAVNQAIKGVQRKIELSQQHRESIRQAIAEGKPVPTEVLADYPELSNTQQSLELKYAEMIVAELISDDKEYRKKEGREPLTDDQYKEVHQVEVHERVFLKLKQEIDAKDYAQLSQKLYPHNRFWRKYFEEYTGVKLGKTLKETIQTLQQFTGFTPEPAPAKVKLSKEEALKRAKSARDEKVLSTRVRYDGVIRTRKENVDYVLSNGGHVEVAEVPSVQEPRNYNRLTWDQQREYERRRKIMKPEYRLYISPGTFYVISKAEYDYATEKENAKPESQPDTDLLAIEFEMAAAALELLDFNAADDMPPVQEDETLEEINETGSFSVKHKASGKEIMVAWKMFIGIHLQHIAFMAFGGERVAFVVKNDRKCIDVGLPDAKLKSELESFFGYKINAGQHIYITIDDDGMEKYEKLAEEFEQAKSGFLNKYARLAAQQPTYYEMRYSVDWGDYSTTIERSIALMRKALPIDRNVDKPVVSYYLSNNTIGDKADEWDADWKAVTKGDESLTRVVIDNDLARKWIIIHNELQAAKEEKDQQIKAEKDKKAAEEAKRRADIFEQAKTTGKPVQLYSHFVSGNSVPKKYRDDEDNDMGNIVVYAMPDGTTTEKFFPAY